LSIEEFILAVKEERFVEAHELLEDEWRYYKKTEEKNKAKAIQGLINGATALALFRKK
jgi:predicted metal-dependent hydrolase